MRGFGERERERGVKHGERGGTQKLQNEFFSNLNRLFEP